MKPSPFSAITLVLMLLLLPQPSLATSEEARKSVWIRHIGGFTQRR
jgi:hypothetical protein